VRSHFIIKTRARTHITKNASEATRQNTTYVWKAEGNSSLTSVGHRPIGMG
jgi:hypothetical protein